MASDDQETVTATVKVTFVMEYQAGSWGPRCDMAQVISQAQDQAREAAQRILFKTDGLLKVTKVGGPSIHIPEGDF